MNYNRLFYMNITYSCNNKCIFCISHNTKHKTKRVINPFNIIEKVNQQYEFDEGDIFIINGGEPTLSPDFGHIVDFLKNLQCKIVIYTNGRFLHNWREYFNDRHIFWIVPFYGLEDFHDKYTGVKGSFKNTFSSLEHVLNKQNVSIKFLINEEGQIDDFFKLATLLEHSIKELHISFILDNNFLHRYRMAGKMRECITSWNDKFILKLSNIPLCQLNMFFDIKRLKTNEINEYYYICENEHVKTISYDENHSWQECCSNCKLAKICCDTYKRYRVLKLDGLSIRLEEE